MMTGIGVPAIFALARAVQNSGKSVTAAEQPDGEVAEERERADRDGERGQADDRHEEAVERAADHAHDEGGEGRELEWDP